MREVERLCNEAGDRPARFAELILVSRGDEESLLPQRVEQLGVRLFSRWVGETSQKWPAAPNNIPPDELIKLGTVTALTHLIKPRCKDAAVPRRRAARLLKRRRRTTPTFSLGNLSCLPWRNAQCRRTDVHHLTLCARRNKAQLRNSSPNQCNTRAVWRALGKCT